jgi:hypothetical protein
MKNTLFQLIIKYILFLSIFIFIIYLTPNFIISNICILFISSFFIILLDYFISLITGINEFTLGNGLIGFFSCIIILFITQFFISGYYISILSSIFAALIYSILNYILTKHSLLA